MPAATLSTSTMDSGAMDLKILKENSGKSMNPQSLRTRSVVSVMTLWRRTRVRRKHYVVPGGDVSMAVHLIHIVEGPRGRRGSPARTHLKGDVIDLDVIEGPTTKEVHLVCLERDMGRRE